MASLLSATPTTCPRGLRWRLACWLLAAWLGLLGLPAGAGTLDRNALQALLPPPLVLGERSPSLPAWPVFRREGAALTLQGHVFETIDLEPVAGYGGRPVNMLVLLDRDGVFLDVRLLSHAEPLFTSPQGTAVLAAFAQQYKGLSLQQDIQVLSASAQRQVTDTSAALHGVLTGTVSALAIDRAVLESAAQLARLRAQADSGQPAASPPRGPDDRYRKTGWNELVRLGLVQPWRLSNRQVQAAFDNGPAAWRDPGGRSWPDGPAVDLWIALAGLPQAGRNLFDAAGWQQVRAARQQGHTVLLLLDGGRYPVAASAAPDAARAAVLQLRQQGRLFTLQPLAWTGGMALSGSRSGVPRDAVPRLFTVAPAADGTRLDAEQPLDLLLAVQRGGTEPGSAVQVAVQRPFAVPEVATWRPQPERPAWQAGWARRTVDLAILATGLVVLVVALARQRWLTARPGRLAVFRTGYLLFTLGFIGWWAQGQLTIVSVTAAIEAGVAGRALDFLLTDPVALLLWAFTGVTLLVWGRGTFCGWLCPFGALQELASQLARRLGLRQRPLHRRLDQRLKWLKYGVLAVLCSGAALAAGWTDTAVEVEPFKTAISQTFQRDWPYVAWALACVGASVLVFRGYCRYLCPLGAALALLDGLRRWAWIPRRAECGTPCQTCRHRCGYQAITPAGQVQYAECFQCLDCVAIHQDAQQCLPLLQQARRVIPIGVVR
ncbi:4Fe-4S binding protein [Pseudaquabacterium pictum]|uniref:Regulatory protein NosR n=1 Tax=Pseudaquabacterium pictum TaxID=2315236 RepID=A0A480AMP2_9BURK|nr:4Fe-4S binding protein [Rubrivivax pictus]GCL62939.1 regulatory protein NosR [Rubrivivax pictus]